MDRSREENAGAKILLVGDDSQLMSTQAILLGTHGYEVETAGNASEARARWHASRPDLVLLALSDSADGNFGLWQSIRESDPAQRVGFLLSDSQHLCRVFFDGELVLQGEGPDDIVVRVRALLGEELSCAAPVTLP
jgi:DNA-binding response OmpR family regulator